MRDFLSLLRKKKTNCNWANRFGWIQYCFGFVLRCPNSTVLWLWCVFLSVVFVTFQTLQLVVWSVSMCMDWNRAFFLVIPKFMPNWKRETHLNNSFGSFFDLIPFSAYFRTPVSESESSSVIRLLADTFEVTTTVWLLICLVLPADFSTSKVESTTAAPFGIT